MRTTKFKLFTSKLNLQSKNLITNFMIKSGLLRKLSSGIYVWLPLGVKIINNIKNIILHEMNNIGAMEINLPILQPIDMWYKSKRYFTYGNELYKIIDRHNKSFILTPTNEEAIANCIEKEKKISKIDLPIIFYQITKKFRDERRSKYGIMRTKEFLMKDAYSFHKTPNDLINTYNLIIKSYKRIFVNMNLNFNIVNADNGAMGGTISHEFHVLSKYGEDQITLSNDNYIYNIKLANKTKKIIKKRFLKSSLNYKNILLKKRMILSNILHDKLIFEHFINKFLKTIFIKIKNNKKLYFLAVIINYINEISFTKLSKHLKLNIHNLQILNHQEICKIFKIKCKIEFLSPLGLKIPILIDKDLLNYKNFIMGANKNQSYYININWSNDFSLHEQQVGDICMDKNIKHKLNVKNSLEIAHIFQLGNKYLYQERSLYMGCYGIGINRLLFAVIEQNINKEHNRIVWPRKISPFQVLILPINMFKSELVYKISIQIYNDLLKNNIEVLFYDSKETPGVMFYDMELLGIPHALILSEKKLQLSIIEYQNRKNNTKYNLYIKDIIKFLYDKIHDIIS